MSRAPASLVLERCLDTERVRQLFGWTLTEDSYLCCAVQKYYADRQQPVPIHFYQLKNACLLTYETSGYVLQQWSTETAVACWQHLSQLSAETPLLCWQQAELQELLDCQRLWHATAPVVAQWQDLQSCYYLAQQPEADVDWVARWLGWWQQPYATQGTLDSAVWQAVLQLGLYWQAQGRRPGEPWQALVSGLQRVPGDWQPLLTAMQSALVKVS